MNPVFDGLMQAECRHRERLERLFKLEYKLFTYNQIQLTEPDSYTDRLTIH